MHKKVARYTSFGYHTPNPALTPAIYKTQRIDQYDSGKPMPTKFGTSISQLNVLA